MAITKITVPELIQPVVNPFWLQVTSTNSTQSNYQTLYDVYSGSTGSTRINRLQVSTRPDGTIVASPAKVLQPLLTLDSNIQSITGGTISTNLILKYYIIISEEYGSLLTGTTIYNNLANFSGYTFGGVVQYQELANWNYLDYTPTPLNFPNFVDFLTNSPDRLYVRENDRQTLSYFNNTTGVTITDKPAIIVIETFQLSGGSIQSYFWNDGVYNNTGTNSLYAHAGIGPWNLNNIPNIQITGTTQPIIDFNRDEYYTVNVYSPGSALVFPVPLFNIKTFILDKECYKYETKRLMFANPFGNYDYFNFVLVSKKISTITRTEYSTPLPWNYSVGDAETKVLNTQGQETVIINSNWITEEEHAWLRDILMSKQCWELQSDGTKLPIVITDTTWEEKKRVNNFIFNATISYKYGYNLNGQRS